MHEWRVVWKVGEKLIGASPWEQWDDDDMSHEEIVDDALEQEPGASPSLAERVFWEESGISLHIEVRPRSSEED